MNILYLTNRLPYPLHSGYLRQFYFIRELARRHRVTLVSIVSADCPPSDVEALAEWTERVITVPQEVPFQGGIGKRWRRVLSAFRPDPTLKRFCMAVREQIRQGGFDAAVVHGLTMAATLKELAGVRVVADICDANSLRFLEAARYTRLARLPLVLWDFLTARRLERRFMDSESQLVFATARDRDALLGSGPRTGTVVPNGVDVEYWARGAGELGRETIIFTGAMSYPPNTDAALQLLQTILPRVRPVVPQVRVLIVGRDPPPRLVSAARQAGATLTGTVEDVRPYMDRATVFAAPLRYGTGIQNKILQSLAMQVPIVATPSAIEGLQAADGEQPPLDIAGLRADFSQLVCRHLTAPVAQRAPHRAGRAFVERNFCWSHSGLLLDQLIHSR